MYTKEQRTRNALWGLFIGDSLAMPAHWYYNLDKIKKDFDKWNKRKIKSFCIC